MHSKVFDANQKFQLKRMIAKILHRTISYKSAFLKGVKAISNAQHVEHLLKHSAKPALSTDDYYSRYFDSNVQMTNQEYTTFTEYLTQYSKNVPLAYIVGQVQFWTLNLKVTKDTLIPRPDTEMLIETMLVRL